MKPLKHWLGPLAVALALCSVAGFAQTRVDMGRLSPAPAPAPSAASPSGQPQ